MTNVKGVILIDKLLGSAFTSDISIGLTRFLQFTSPYLRLMQIMKWIGFIAAAILITVCFFPGSQLQVNKLLSPA